MHPILTERADDVVPLIVVEPRNTLHCLFR